MLLNACYSEIQAEEIAKHIEYVIGMKEAIGDRAAIEFVRGFYDAIGAERSVEDAYRFGCNAIRMENLPDHLTPILKTRNNVNIKSVSNPIADRKTDNPPVPTSEGWNDEDWSTLVYTIQQGKCILLLGPDTAFVQTNEQDYSLTEMLANELVEKLKSAGSEYLDRANFAQVAQYYAMEHGRNALESKVYNFYRDKRGLTNDLYRNLAALPFYLTITSTLDNLWAEALREENKPPIIERYHYRGKKQAMVKMGTMQNPLIYYLYGSLEETNSLVLTENDLLDFLVNVIAQNPPLPDNILSNLQDRNKSLLFLGFGFKHWYLRILLHILQIRRKESSSFALEQLTPQSLMEFERTIIFFRQSDYKIHIYQQDLLHFANTLRQRYQAELSSSLSVSSHLSNAPSIFICHAPDDQAHVEHIAQQLETSGFRPWRDTEQMRGTEMWNTLLEQTISESDYVLVLHTKTLCGFQMPYIKTEIECALELQNQFKPGIRFVIPIKMEECSLLEDLDYLQPIDLAQPENFKVLLQTLKRDQERRKRK